jgi:hypothetical protein
MTRYNPAMGKSNKKSEAAVAAASDTPEKKEIPSATFEADTDGEICTYKFTAYSFMLDGKVITAAEALNDETVLAKLVELKAGVIAPVE